MQFPMIDDVDRGRPVTGHKRNALVSFVSARMQGHSMRSLRRVISRGSRGARFLISSAIIAILTLAVGSYGASSQVTLAPASLAFGNVLVGNTNAVSAATLTNSTAGSVTGITASLSGTGANSFAIVPSGTNACGATLASNASCNIYVNFIPGSAANFTATLSVSDSAASSPQTAALAGTGISFDSSVGTAQAVQLLTVSFAMAGTLNSIEALTKGAPNLDYAITTGGSCATGTAYTEGQTCTVNLVFTPAYAGQRDGAVVLLDASGDVLGTTYLWGMGHGPQVVFNPAPPSQAPTYYKNPSSGLALDGAGDSFVLNNTTANIYEFVWNGAGYNSATVADDIGPYETDGLMPSDITSMVIDSAGNLIVGGFTFHPDNVISVLLLTGAGYGVPIRLNNSVFSSVADQIAIDRQGNVFYTDGNAGRVVEVPRTSGGYGQATAVSFPGSDSPEGVAVDANENLYVLAGSTIYMLPWTGSSFGTATNISITGAPIDASNLAVDGSGDLYFTACFTSAECSGNEYQVFEIPYNGTGFGAQISVYQLYNGSVFNATVPNSLQLDGAGNVYTTSEGISRNTGPTLIFATTAVGATSSDSPQTVIATNIGNQSLIFSGSTPDPAYPVNFPENISDSNLCASSADLAQGGTCDVSVNFTPTAGGSLSGNVVLTDDNLNQAGATQLIPVNGQATGSAPVASLSPAIAFGNQTKGVTSAAMSATLSNTGNATLNISGVTISGTNAADFAISTGANACGTTLAQSSNCSIYVTFKPSTTAAESATLNVADNAASSPQTSSLTGTGTHAPVPIASLSPAIAFGNEAEGVTSAAMSATLSNTGNATLNISGVTISGTNAADFAIATGTNACGTTLAQNSNCSIYVTFKPSTIAAESATLNVADNATGSPQTAALSGTGTAPPGGFLVNSPTPPQTVQPGGSAQYTINVAVNPAGDVFNSAVTLAASGLPAGAVASFSPSSVTPGSGVATSMMTVRAPATNAKLAPLSPGPRSPMMPATLALCLAGAYSIFRRRRRAHIDRWHSWLLLAAVGAACALGVTACSNGGFALSTPTSYTITVTGSSGSTQQSATVQLTVE
jgi:trimeric autotransporter adhesin